MMRFLPWIGVALAAVMVYAMGATIVKSWEKSIRKEEFIRGVMEERTRQQKLADEQTRVLQEGFSALDRKLNARNTKQNADDNRRLGRIENEIQAMGNRPECVVSDGLLRERNATRSSLTATQTPASAPESQ